MTEEEWLACTEPSVMLEFLQGNANDRKLRLFSCACCRRIMNLFPDERSQRAVELSSGFADGIIARDDLILAAQNAGVAAEAAHWENRPGPIQTAAEAAAMVSTETLTIDVAINIVQTAAEALGDQATDDAWEETWQTPGKTNDEQWKQEKLFYDAANGIEMASQATLLRDIFGNPFRPLAVDPSSRNMSVVRLAQGMYDARSFDKMPDLADALERAGCRDEAILGHCRESGEHVRGCWVVDLVLGKE